jgi:hypothetical protein
VSTKFCPYHAMSQSHLVSNRAREPILIIRHSGPPRGPLAAAPRPVIVIETYRRKDDNARAPQIVIATARSTRRPPCAGPPGKYLLFNELRKTRRTAWRPAATTATRRPAVNAPLEPWFRDASKFGRQRRSPWCSATGRVRPIVTDRQHRRRFRGGGDPPPFFSIAIRSPSWRRRFRPTGGRPDSPARETIWRAARVPPKAPVKPAARSFDAPPGERRHQADPSHGGRETHETRGIIEPSGGSSHRRRQTGTRGSTGLSWRRRSMIAADDPRTAASRRSRASGASRAIGPDWWTPPAVRADDDRVRPLTRHMTTSRGGAALISASDAFSGFRERLRSDDAPCRNAQYPHRRPPPRHRPPRHQARSNGSLAPIHRRFDGHKSYDTFSAARNCVTSIYEAFSRFPWRSRQQRFGLPGAIRTILAGDRSRQR